MRAEQEEPLHLQGEDTVVAADATDLGDPRADLAVVPLHPLATSPQDFEPDDPFGPDSEYVAAIERTLRAARKHLGVEVAFISEFVDGDRVFRYVDARAGKSAVAVDGRDALKDSYCHYVANGELPEYLQDPSQVPLAASLPATKALPVGTHLSVPIKFSDGQTYGTFCCFDHDVRPDVDPHTVVALRMMADLVAEYLEVLDDRKRAQRERRDRIDQIIEDGDALTMFVQPIIDLNTGATVGAEALARFRDADQGPAWFFQEASDVGLGVELEVKALKAALNLLDVLPSDVRLNVNLSPDSLFDPACIEAMMKVPPGRLVIEVTEHYVVNDYTTLNEAGSRLKALGIATSIDDVGAGFSGLSRILQTSAEELKIDRAIVSGVHNDPAKQALIEALAAFCASTNRRLLGEGVECEEELAMLRSLGVDLAQGYYFAKPAPVDVIFPQP